MTRYLTILLTTICLTLSMSSKADSWIDPSWKYMLDSSDVIALIQYTSDGDFRSSAKILTIYKGSLKIGDEIWVSGFSNRYGPIDKMSTGDKYLAFLNRARLTEESTEYWNEQLLKTPELKEYVEALKTSKAFFVWSPTSGDLKVKGKKVQVDLIQSTFCRDQNFYSLTEFENFLKAYYNNRQKSKLCQELLSALIPASENKATSQNLMKLYLLGYNVYDPIFESYSTIKNPSSKFALALLMGNITNEQSNRILLTLLQDEHSLVQGEAVRQLSKNPSDEVGAVLLKQLKDANPYNSGPSNIMDPLMNRVEGGKSQIISTLGEIGYKPAIPELLSMLETKDEYDFTAIVETLRKLETREYASYINKHLDNLDDGMVLQLCFIIRDDSLTECIPSLMNYVKTHDRTVWPTKECSISRYFGLAHFNTDTVKQFLLEDFLSVMKMPNTHKEAIDTKQKWVEEYMSSFRGLGIVAHKDLFYDYMYNYYGFNSNFKTNPRYFERKWEIEDSLIKVAGKLLQPIDPDVQITAMVLLDSQFKPINYAVKYKLSQEENFYKWRENTLDTLNQLIYSQTTINKQHLIWSVGNYTGLSGEIKMERFGDIFMSHFLEYISELADQEDVRFLENLKKYNYAETNFEKEQLDEYLLKAKAAIGK